MKSDVLDVLNASKCEAPDIGVSSVMSVLNVSDNDLPRLLREVQEYRKKYNDDQET